MQNSIDNEIDKDHLEISRLIGEIYKNAHLILLDLDFNLNFEITTTSLNLFSNSYKIDTMATNFMNSLMWELMEITEIYAYAIASDNVSKTLNDGPTKNHIIYCQRDLHFRNFFHRWFAFLEHIAFMINNFSRLELINEERDVSLFNIRKEMKSIAASKIGYISSEDFKIIINTISAEKIYNNMKDEDIKEFRNILVHRFHIEPDLKVLAYFNKDGEKLTFKYCKAFSFDEYMTFAFNILNNLYDILNDLSKLNLMKSVINLKCK